MRILFVTSPLQGHLLPLIPLARACRDAGHEVHVASGGFPPDTAGLRTHDIGGRFSLARSAMRVSLGRPRLAWAEMHGTAGHDFVGELDLDGLGRELDLHHLRHGAGFRPDRCGSGGG